MSKSKCPIKVLSPRRTHHLPPLPEQLRLVVQDNPVDALKLLQLYNSSNSPMKLPPFVIHEQEACEENGTHARRKSSEPPKLKLAIDNFALKVGENIKERALNKTPKKNDVTFGIQN